MKYLLTLVMAILSFTGTFSQKTPGGPDILGSKEVTKIFPDSVRKRLNINFPIFRVYRYSDKSGQYYCILTESMDKITEEKDTASQKIKALNLKVENGSLARLWEINDNIIKDERQEYTIRFWTRYSEFKDFDKDGLADPIIIYGTLGMNGHDDGRIKIIIYYKGQKIAIRHQNGVLDFERETQVEKAFYELPQSIQASVIQKMEEITEHQHGIFPAGWHSAMKNRKTTFNER